MKQGDFRSVAGTWRNSAGWEFHIDKDGNITSGGKRLKSVLPNNNSKKDFSTGLWFQKAMKMHLWEAPYSHHP